MDYKSENKDSSTPHSPFLAEMKRDFSGKGSSYLSKDGVFRVLSKDYKVVKARGLNPDEIKEFLSLFPSELLDPGYLKELEGVDGSKITSYEELYNPAPGILPERPSDEEIERRKNVTEEQKKTFEKYQEAIKMGRYGDAERFKEEAIERRKQEVRKGKDNNN